MFRLFVWTSALCTSGVCFVFRVAYQPVKDCRRLLVMLPVLLICRFYAHDTLTAAAAPTTTTTTSSSSSSSSSRKVVENILKKKNNAT